jgi:hypothetical protein
MNAKAQKTEIPAVILFGKDETAKPHASFFHEADLPGALNAAELMKMKVLRTDTDERRAVAADLPQGRVFASGKAFVPFVAAPLYHRLVALARAADSICPSAADWVPGDPKNESVTAPESNRAPFGQPEGESAHLAGAGPANRPEPAPTEASENSGGVARGSLVLASVGSAEGWWESLVIEMHDDLMTLKWRDWPEEPPFVRRTIANCGTTSYQILNELCSQILKSLIAAVDPVASRAYLVRQRAAP